MFGYIKRDRQYTWDKAVEDTAKSIGTLVGKHAPTIQQPKKYKNRFRDAMKRYFMVSPDRKCKRPTINMNDNNNNNNNNKNVTLTDAVRDIHIQC